MTTSVLNDPSLEALLAQLHAQSDRQIETVDAYESDASRPRSDAEEKAFLSDKLVALDRDKAEFCYLLCRALGATRIVEAGTSYGVSTPYLAAAVRDNVRASGGSGIVIGTEHEPAKAEAARANVAAARRVHRRSTPSSRGRRGRAASWCGSGRPAGR